MESLYDTLRKTNQITDPMIPNMSNPAQAMTKGKSAAVAIPGLSETSAMVTETTDTNKEMLANAAMIELKILR